MSRKNNIRIFYVSTVISACLCLYMGYQMANDLGARKEPEEKSDTEWVSEQPAASETETPAAPAANVEVPYEFMIVEEEGYLLVYMQDLETVYMYTDIRMNELSEDLQEEIRRGKPFSDLKELFGFLENYSS